MLSTLLTLALGACSSSGSGRVIQVDGGKESGGNAPALDSAGPASAGQEAGTPGDAKVTNSLDLATPQLDGQVLAQPDGPPTAQADGQANDQRDSQTAAQADGQTTVQADSQPAAQADTRGTVPSDSRPEPSETNDSAYPTLDAPSGDSPPQPDGPTDTAGVRVDSAPDIAASLSPLNTCKRFVHYPNPPATCATGSNQEGVALNTTLFTSDGKYLVTAANNGWVKLWKVSDSGLEDTGIILTGSSYRISAALSPAGEVLAVVSQSGDIDLYDLPATISTGAATQVGSLAAGKLAHTVSQSLNRAFFTTDGRQLVALYPTNSNIGDQKTMVAVWDLATRTVVREFAFDFPTVPLTVAAAPATGALWTVVSKTESIPDDAGSHNRASVTVFDGSLSNPSKFTFVVSGDVTKATFSADAKTLAIGTDEGEVSLWNLSDKNNIQPVGSPLVSATDTFDSIYGLSYAKNEQYLVAGSEIFRGNSSLRIINLQNQVITRRQTEYSPRCFGFASDGITWAYGLGGCGFVYLCKN